MKKFLTIVTALFVIAVAGYSSEIKMVDDEALAEVSAQGFNVNFQTIDTLVNSNNNYNVISNLPSQLNMVDSLMVSGMAQQNAFVPINAVNSAVNVPINIVIVMNSQLSGGININNVLDAVLH